VECSIAARVGTIALELLAGNGNICIKPHIVQWVQIQGAPQARASFHAPFGKESVDGNE